MKADRVSQAGYFDRVYSGVGALAAAGDSTHPAYNPMRRFSYSEICFAGLLDGLGGKSVLSLGGGVDTVGLYLSLRGSTVTSVDVSPRAVEMTNALSVEYGVDGLLTAVLADWAAEGVGGRYDAVVTHDSLHHMDVGRSVEKIRDALREGGVYVGMEPVCLSDAVRRVHERLPFHPYPYVGGERELSDDDLRLIEGMFSRVEFSFFDILARESVSYMLYRLGFRGAITALGRFDHALLARLPRLKAASSYAVFEAAR